MDLLIDSREFCHTIDTILSKAYDDAGTLNIVGIHMEFEELLTRCIIMALYSNIMHFFYFFFCVGGVK